MNPVPSVIDGARLVSKPALPVLFPDVDRDPEHRHPRP